MHPGLFGWIRQRVGNVGGAVLLGLLGLRLWGGEAVSATAGFATRAQARTACDGFVKALAGGDTNAPLFLRDHWVNQEDSRRVAEALRNQWSGAEALMKANFGPRLADGVEFLGTRSLGTNTIKFVYLLKHEAGFYGFTVILYHPTEDWRLAGFTFGDQSRADTFALSRTESALPPGLDTVLGGSMELFAQGQWHRAMQPLVGLWYKPDEAEGSLGDMERRVRTGSALLESELGERLSRTGPGLLGIWSVGESLKCVGYELKYQRGTFPWVFMFYKAHQDWKLISLTTGSSIPEWMMPMFAVSEPQR